MGQKVHPNGMRVGVIRDWNTHWYASKKNFADYLVEDNKIRKYIKKTYYSACISKINIERAIEGDSMVVAINIYTARPGMLIGKEAVGVDAIREGVAKVIGKPVNNVKINIMEVRNADTNAQLVAESIASQIEKRTSYRRAMKQAMGRAMKAGAKGIKLLCSGRLGGAEIARSEGYHDGSIPLQTIRADIEYGFCEAHTTYGRIGVKVWIYKGEVLGHQLTSGDREQKREGRDNRDNRDRRDRKPGGRRPRKEGGK